MLGPWTTPHSPLLFHSISPTPVSSQPLSCWNCPWLPSSTNYNQFHQVADGQLHITWIYRQDDNGYPLHTNTKSYKNKQKKNLKHYYLSAYKAKWQQPPPNSICYLTYRTRMIHNPPVSDLTNIVLSRWFATFTLLETNSIQPPSLKQYPQSTVHPLWLKMLVKAAKHNQNFHNALSVSDATYHQSTPRLIPTVLLPVHTTHAPVQAAPIPTP